MSSLIVKNLLEWYYLIGRKDLPWRQNLSPYRVWVSEIMLQQTQVATVIPYYQQFMQRFPTVQHLANAELDEVLHLWSGLGYYTRARNLHKTAILINQNFYAKFPDSVTELTKLPGIGLSTAGAIAAISHNISAPILDGNVKRVLTRLYAIDGWPGTTSIQKKLWALSKQLTPQYQVSDYTQAIMDLGALICTRTQPKCQRCPLQNQCTAYKENKQNQLPTAKPKKILPHKWTQMLIIKNQENKILLIKRPPVGIWGGLWSLPECDSASDAIYYCQNELAIHTEYEMELATFKHTFSHYHLHIRPISLSLTTRTPLIKENNHWHWYDQVNGAQLGLPTPIKRILSNHPRISNPNLAEA